MNTRVYLNLLELDSVMKNDKDHSFAMMPKYKCEKLLSYASDKNEELAHTEATTEEKNIICNKFTECHTMGMAARLSNQLYIDEE